MPVADGQLGDGQIVGRIRRRPALPREPLADEAVVFVLAGPGVPRAEVVVSPVDGLGF